MGITVPSQPAPQRLDIVLTTLYPEKTRSQWQKLLIQGRVLCNHQLATKRVRVKGGELVQWLEPETALSSETALPRYQLLAETPDYLVIDKPAGLVVHPATHHDLIQTLIGQVLNDYPAIRKIGEDPSRSGLVHRLDRNVSGVMVIARTSTMFEHLKTQFKRRWVHKEYLVLVHGCPSPVTGVINWPLGRSRRTGRISVQTTAIDQKTRKAQTNYNTLECFGRYSFLSVQPQTGRTHQIRAHLYALGHPIVGDTVYQSKRFRRSLPLSRLFLHAHQLSFEDLQHQRQIFTSPLPEELLIVLDSIKKN